MKIIKILYSTVILTTVILLMGSADARDLILSETGSNFTVHALSSTVQGSELPYVKATARIGAADTLPPSLRDLDAVLYSPVRASSALDGNKSDERAVSGDGSPGPEPGILLVLGSVLMGIALYRRYRYK